VKAPTGDDAVSDYSFRPTGPELRAVDPAIEPGDGGWGIILSGNGFAKVYTNTFVYANGFYLINPRETNGVRTVNFDVPPFTNGDPGLMVNSVPDQVLVRGGVTHAIWPSKGLDLSFGARREGIPAHDRWQRWLAITRIFGFSRTRNPHCSWSALSFRNCAGRGLPVWDHQRPFRAHAQSTRRRREFLRLPDQRYLFVRVLKFCFFSS